MYQFSRAAMALLVSALFVVGSVGAARSATGLSPQTTADLYQTYHLLATSAYAEVSPQKIVDGGLAALAAVAKKNKTHVKLPAIRVNGNADAMGALQKTIVAVAPKLHLTPTQAAYVALFGMAGAMKDKYTTFFTPDQFKQFNDELDPAKISGIGVLVGSDADTGYTEATYVVPGTPADRAGLQSGDDITAVNGTSTKGLKLDAITKLLRGKTGTVANVSVSRNGASIGAPIAIVRAQIQPPSVVYRMLPNDVAYLSIFAFGQDTPAQFDDALAKVRDDGAKALVVDLRYNGGGYVDSALQISSDFISGKPLYTVVQRGEAPQTYDADVSDVSTLPLAVLVNAYSASASEITAGALQDDNAAVLVGEKTFGKGVMQTVTRLPGGAAVKITTAHYLTPAKRDINLRGLQPDLKVSENKKAVLGDPARDAQLQAAINLLQKKIALAK